MLWVSRAGSQSLQTYISGFRRIYVVVSGPLTVPLVLCQICSMCARKRVFELRSVYPWGFTQVFLKTWEPSEIMAECYMSISMIMLKYTHNLDRLADSLITEGCYMIVVPSLKSLLPDKRASSDQPKGQHLTFNVLSSTFGSHYTLAWLSSSDWKAESLLGLTEERVGGLGFWPLLTLWLHQLPYSRNKALP